MRKRRKFRSPLWREYEIDERLDWCFSEVKEPPVDEGAIRRRLLQCFPHAREGIPIQIIPHTARELKSPGCPRVLFILSKTNNFANRTLEALDTVRRCRDKVDVVLYLTLSWSIRLDRTLSSIAKIFHDYGVSDICRREPVASASPICY